MAADTRFRGPQGTPGSALDANSLRLAVEPRSLWCADGQMCKTPTNSPGTIINGSLNIGNWTISENANGNLQFSKKGFANGNVIFDTTFQPEIGMTISSGNLLAKNDLKSGYAYINHNINAGGYLEANGYIQSKTESIWAARDIYLGGTTDTTAWKMQGGTDFRLSKTKSDGKLSQFRLNGGGNDNAYLSGNLTQNNIP